MGMSSTASELSASKVWVKDALQSFLPLSSSSILQSKQPSHHQSPSPSALVGLLENEKFLNPRYKTEICRNFKERAKCIYGDKCQFAHGRRELRDVVRYSKYKTKPCQKYWLIGYCAYGPRCNFLHDEASEQELMDWNSIHNDQSVGSTSRPTTPTTLFEVNHDMVEDTMMSKGSLLSMNYQIHPTPIPSKEINDQGIGVWTAP